MVAADTVEKPSGLLFEGPEWDFDKLRRVYDAIEDIALNELGLDVYPNQIEVITSEQMLDAYASIGLPLMYRHWSFGKRFAREEALYRHGLQGLAYEIVINSSPCISYIMEENSMAMQTLVLSHAAFGHNHFFKNNYLFRQWTDATGILDYLTFARDFVSHSEEQHGVEAVERALDAAHALMNHGVHRYARPPKLNLEEERQRQEDRRRHFEENYDDIWRTALIGEKREEDVSARAKQRTEIRRKLGLPEENILYFLEKRAPRLEPWQRELVRIVRHISQYFYPQKQTRLMNEGCATFVHYEIMTRLHEKGLINDGNRDPYGTLRYAWANYRDESFVLQYLSPRLMREFRLFRVLDEAGNDALIVRAIHDERGYRDIRRSLARHYDLARHDPDIQIRDVDLAGDRCLILTHAVHNGILLDEPSCRAVLDHLGELWRYGIRLEEIDASSDRVLKTHEVPARL